MIYNDIIKLQKELIDAANKLKDLIRGMENMTDIKGYIIYTEEAAKPLKTEATISNVFISEIVKKF